MALVVKNLPAIVADLRDEDAGLIPRLGKSPGEGHSNSLHYCCLENPTHRGAWQATAHWVAKSQLPSPSSSLLQADSLHALIQPHPGSVPGQQDNAQTQSHLQLSFLGGSVAKESACQCRSCSTCGFSPWVQTIPWRRNPLQYSCLENLTDRSATIHGVTKSWTRLSMHACNRVSFLDPASHMPRTALWLYQN